MQKIEYLSAGYPLIIAGDLFDDWEEGAEIVNLFLKVMGKRTVFSIPGQHDMPNHNLSLIYKSPYHTLSYSMKRFYDCSVNASLGPKSQYTYAIGDRQLRFSGFAWNDNYSAKGIDSEFQKLIDKNSPKNDLQKACINIAIVHAYCHNGERVYPGATKENHAETFQKAFYGWDFVIVGDNHSPFTYGIQDNYPTIVNCGGVFNRNRAEAGKPRYLYELRSDKTVRSHLLNGYKTEEWASKAEDTLPNLPDDKLVKLLESGLEASSSLFRGAAGVLDQFKKVIKTQPDSIKKQLQKLLNDAKRDV